MILEALGASSPVLPLALLCAGALLACWRYRRIAREARASAERRDAEVEALQDRIWRLAEAEESTRALIEAQLDLIVARDAQGRITFANEGFARLLGQPRDGLVGTGAAPRVLETGAAELRPDGARAFDEAVETPDGPRWIAWIETRVPSAIGEVETLRAGRDITARVVSERVIQESKAKAEAASEAKSRFLATVSHEFRTPLNGILGMAELILDTRLNPEQTTYVRAIKTSGEALLSLIDEILDFSKIEAGRLDLAAEPFHLRQVVEGVVELLAPKAQGKGIEIAAYVAPDVPRKVLGDADRLRQVLVNLAGNAVKFTDLGGVGITVEREGTGRLLVTVSDTGPGIDPERLPLLFEEFEQGDGSASRRHGGTGLGLAITRRIVERMQGAVDATSEPGRGSAFTVTLPLADADSGRARDQAPDSLQGQRVVILARSPFEAPYLARRLREAGAEVAVTEAPDDALATIAVSSCDLFIADCALGIDTVRSVAVEARDAGAKRSLVLLSPFDRRDFGPPAAAGFDAYLVKPVRPRSLYERLIVSDAPAEPARAPRAAARAAQRPASRSAPKVGDKAMAKPATARRRKAPVARVLLAEDNEINALLAMRSLEKLGALVDWAKDGREALALAEASFSGLRPPYELVLMDIRMPGLDGLEATRRIRAVEGALGRGEPTRIIALTANALQEDQAAAREAGLDGFLAKPFELQELTAVLAGAGAPLARAS